MEEDTKKFYLEIDGKIEEPITSEAMGNKLLIIQGFMKDLGFKHLRAELKENPTYDSFGNLWD